MRNDNLAYPWHGRVYDFKLYHNFNCGCSYPYKVGGSFASLAYVLLLLWNYCGYHPAGCVKRYSEYAAEHIQKEFEFYRDSIQMLCGDAALFYAAENSDVEKVQKLLKEFTLKSPYRFQYTLLDNERTIISSNLYEMNRQKFYASYDTQSILDEIDENIDVSADRISRAGYSNGQETIYQFGGAVQQGGKTAGYLILDISRRDILNFFSERLVSEVALVDRYQNIIFTTLNTEQFFKDSKGGVIWNCDWESHDDVIVNKKSTLQQD